MLKFIPYHLIPQKIFTKSVEHDLMILKSIPDHFMTQDV